jgi:hypothetical protein
MSADTNGAPGGRDKDERLALGRVVGTERRPNTPHEFHLWTALDSPVGIGTSVRVDGAHPIDGQLPHIYGVVTDGPSYTSVWAPPAREESQLPARWLVAFRLAPGIARVYSAPTLEGDARENALHGNDATWHRRPPPHVETARRGTVHRLHARIWPEARGSSTAELSQGVNVVILT